MSIVIGNRRTQSVVQTGSPTYRFNVARPTPLGNPFVIGRDGDRAEVIRKYSEWLYEQLRANPRTPAGQYFDTILMHAREHRNIELMCWCAPLPCHAEVIRRELLAALQPEVS